MNHLCTIVLLLSILQFNYAVPVLEKRQVVNIGHGTFMGNSFYGKKRNLVEQVNPALERIRANPYFGKKKRALGWPLAGTGFEEGMTALKNGMQTLNNAFQSNTQYQQPVYQQFTTASYVTQRQQPVGYNNFAQFQQTLINLKNNLDNLITIIKTWGLNEKVISDNLNSINNALYYLEIAARNKNSQNINSLVQSTTQRPALLVQQQTQQPVVTYKPAQLVTQSPVVVTTAAQLNYANSWPLAGTGFAQNMNLLQQQMSNLNTALSNTGQTSNGCNGKVCNIAGGTFNGGTFYGK